MKSEKEKLVRKVTVRFKEIEYNKIDTSFKSTTKKKLSEYIRFVLLEKPVTVYTRDKSIDGLVAELILLRNELSAIGNNFNQLVKRLHTMNSFQDIKPWAELNEKHKQKFFEKVTEINQKIIQISDEWLQE
jgi:mobilization protein MobC